MRIVRVGKPDAGGFDEQAKLLGIGKRCLLVEVRRRAREGRCFLGGKNGFVERAVRQANAAFEALAERPGGFEDNGHIEVAWQGHLLPDREC